MSNVASTPKNKRVDAAADPNNLTARPGAWVEVGLTLPIFLAYHFGVRFLDIQNATDFFTRILLWAADGDTLRYLGITAAIGAIFTGIFAIAGKGQAFVPRKFAQIAVEGVVYAVAMRVATGFILAKLPLGQIQQTSPMARFTMSLGAGFYEELAFRVVLFGLGAKLLVWLFAKEKVELVGAGKVFQSSKQVTIVLGWAIASAMVFSGIHYIGAFGDEFKLVSFLARMLLGLALTLIFVTRGFAAAVWTHAVYDIWVLLL
jgi:hypothetical protein